MEHNRLLVCSGPFQLCADHIGTLIAAAVTRMIQRSRPCLSSALRRTTTVAYSRVHDRPHSRADVCVCVSWLDKRRPSAFTKLELPVFSIPLVVYDIVMTFLSVVVKISVSLRVVIICELY